jgi:hypothetical protein
VSILTPDITHKALAQWLGPATVLDKTFKYGYIVDHDGVRKHIHADKLRPYHIRVQELTCDISAVATVCDTDECVTIHHEHGHNNYQDVAIIVPVSDREMLHLEQTCNVFSSSVIFERYVDFGSVQSVDTSFHAGNQLDADYLPSRHILTSELAHLSVTQKTSYLHCLTNTPSAFLRNRDFATSYNTCCE